MFINTNTKLLIIIIASICLIFYFFEHYVAILIYKKKNLFDITITSKFSLNLAKFVFYIILTKTQLV